VHFLYRRCDGEHGGLKHATLHALQEMQAISTSPKTTLAEGSEKGGLLPAPVVVTTAASPWHSHYGSSFYDPGLQPLGHQSLPSSEPLQWPPLSGQPTLSPQPERRGPWGRLCLVWQVRAHGWVGACEARHPWVNSSLRTCESSVVYCALAAVHCAAQLAPLNPCL